jgi:hypothetical protein
MKHIAIKEQYKINDLGDSSEIKEIIQSIDIESNTNVELNFRHCFIDYPATSQIIDKVLSQLSNKPGTKELIIQHDYYLPESTILNLLLLGSKYFNIQAEKEIELDSLTKIINEKITNDNIVIEINVVNRAGELIQAYKYGK